MSIPFITPMFRFGKTVLNLEDRLDKHDKNIEKLFAELKETERRLTDIIIGALKKN